ncbi:MAG: hypothetical protein HN742_03000 [Lentisphaerae bacterium]|jgi:type II secretory pathway component PulK|nr:hypothetical protein [Lentisphaerota bacterium]MBT4814916.1 hypothetical protein [Lentisphaerota bacterium]MBT5605437.1 hypothetical protein [Lentisphaerota bacterium]MBT7060132.1 hypothetical protein [Lentisphaerota bacterium]MBT7840808.1 hypothetical protein [Lentisphaerota bacterium]
MRRKRNNDGGFALVIVLWLAAAMATMALSLAHTIRLEQRRCANTVSTLQAEAAMEAATRYLVSLLQSEDWTSSLPDDETGRLDDVPVGNARFWVVGRPTEENGDSEAAAGLIDEASKLNLNTATADMLKALPGMTAELAAAIIDWRDTDEDPQSGGAESETYLRLSRPYRCKNAPFSSPEELRLVYGADIDLLFGRDRNLNGLQDPWEKDGSLDVLRQQTFPEQENGLLEYVTVWSREHNRQADGSERVNVNDRQATQELQQLIEQQLGAEKAQQVIGNVSTGNSNHADLLAFYRASTLTAQEFAKITDGLTTTDDEWIEGRINVNTAPVPVLACLPGLDENDARALVTFREQNSESLGSIAWVADVLEAERTAEAGQHMTTQISRISADVVAVGDADKGMRRSFFVFDTTTDLPTIVYRRDRAALGWALGVTSEELF